jgi:5-methyltetrahydrofolate--homocysteine methyltransferase
MIRDFLELINTEYCVLDGGFGTMLQERGLTPEDLPEEWNIKRPDIIRDVHLAYFMAGAQIVTTNTFGGSPIKLAMKDKGELVAEINKTAVLLAREAFDLYRTSAESPVEREEPKFIAGSIGPSGKILGMEISEENLSSSYSTQAAVLVDAGVDLFIVETMMDLNEAVVAVRALKKVHNLPVIASLVFNRVKSGGFRTLFGNRISESVERLIEAGADAVGTNCGLIEDYVHVIKEMRACTDRPLVLYPNAGIPKLVDGKTLFEITPESMISYLDRSVEAGATIIGGCCGTTPAYIRRIAERIKHKKRTA